MRFRVTIARSPAELDAVFRGRHDVYAVEEGYLPRNPSGRIFDRFDALPSTTNLIALVDGEVVGGVRLTEPTPVGGPPEEMFPFAAHLPEAARALGGSMLFVKRAHRSSRIGHLLPITTLYLAAQRGATHIYGGTNAEIRPFFHRLGFRALGPVFDHHGLPTCPMVLELATAAPRVRAFIERHGRRHFLGGDDRLFVGSGETLFREGELGDAAYVIVDGTVDIVAAGLGGRPVAVATLGPGEVVGELALLLESPRTATAIARTDLELAVVSQRELLAKVRREPEVSMNLLRLVASRLATVVAEPHAVAA